MRRSLLSLLVLLCAAPALAGSLEPSREDIARAAQTCTTDGAFGVRFGARMSAKNAETDVAPFRVLTMVAGDDRGIFQIVGSASFAKAQMSQEDRVAVAGWFYRALDQKIASTRKFTKREAKDDLTLYTFAEGFLLEVVHLDTEVRLICTRGSRNSVSPNPLK